MTTYRLTRRGERVMAAVAVLSYAGLTALGAFIVLAWFGLIQP